MNYIGGTARWALSSLASEVWDAQVESKCKGGKEEVGWAIEWSGKSEDIYITERIPETSATF